MLVYRKHVFLLLTFYRLSNLSVDVALMWPRIKEDFHSFYLSVCGLYTVFYFGTLIELLDRNPNRGIARSKMITTTSFTPYYVFLNFRAAIDWNILDTWRPFT